MSLLSNSLIIILIFIIVLFSYVVFSLSFTSPKDNSQLLRLPGLALSTSYVGTRILEYKENNNILYFGASEETYADFVYAQ